MKVVSGCQVAQIASGRAAWSFEDAELPGNVSIYSTFASSYPQHSTPAGSRINTHYRLDEHPAWRLQLLAVWLGAKEFAAGPWATLSECVLPDPSWSVIVLMSCAFGYWTQMLLPIRAGLSRLNYIRIGPNRPRPFVILTDETPGIIFLRSARNTALYSLYNTLGRELFGANELHQLGQFVPQSAESGDTLPYIPRFGSVVGILASSGQAATVRRD